MAKKRSAGKYNDGEPTPAAKRIRPSRTVTSSTNSAPSNNLVEKTANNYLKSQKLGSKGIRNEIKKAAESTNIRVSREELDHYQDKLVVPEIKTIATKELLLDWLWMLVCNKNILVYGVGDKSIILSTFVKDYLLGEDVLEIQGNTHPTHWYDGHSFSANIWQKYIKQLLTTIAEDILEDSNLMNTVGQNYLAAAQLISDRLNIHYKRMDHRSQEVLHSSSGLVLLSHGHEKQKRINGGGEQRAYTTGRYAHAQTRLYLVINEIDGSCFHSSEAQSILSILASCPSISLLSSMENINYHYFLTTSNLLTGFDWYYSHLPTYSHHPIPVELHHPLLAIETLSKEHIDMTYTMSSSSSSSSRHHNNHNTNNNNNNMNTHDIHTQSKLKSLALILSSLSRRHKEFLVLFCQEIMIRRLAKQQGQQQQQEGGVVVQKLDRSISVKDTLVLMKSKLVVKNKNELMVLIQEYLDHAVLKYYLHDSSSGGTNSNSGNGGGEQIKILLIESDIETLASFGDKH